MSETNLTALEVERQAYEEFVHTHSVPAYRGLLSDLYAEWHKHNDAFFDRVLLVPHIAVGATPPRRNSRSRPTTGYGGELCITVSAGVAFGINSRLFDDYW